MKASHAARAGKIATRTESNRAASGLGKTSDPAASRRNLSADRRLESGSETDSGSSSRNGTLSPSSQQRMEPHPIDASDAPEHGQTVVAPFPNAREVCLVGSFTDWSDKPVAMAPQPDGTWTAEVRLEPGRYEYKFLVDGCWCDDPSSARVPNDFGTLNNVLRIHALGTHERTQAETQS